MIYAVIYNNTVINRVIWNAEGIWPFPDFEIILDNEGIYNIGMYFENGEWHNPPEPPPTTPDVYTVINDLAEFVKGYLLEEELSESDLYMFSALYPEWKTGEQVAIGDIKSYQAKIYEVIQAHTTQSDWTPDVVPALWKVFTPAGIIPDWVQPQGGHDAYQMGDKVMHNGQVWESTINNNVWEPGVYGWQII